MTQQDTITQYIHGFTGTKHTIDFAPQPSYFGEQRTLLQSPHKNPRALADLAVAMALHHQQQTATKTAADFPDVLPIYEQLRTALLFGQRYKGAVQNLNPWVRDNAPAVGQGLWHYVQSPLKNKIAIYDKLLQQLHDQYAFAALLQEHLQNPLPDDATAENEPAPTSPAPENAATEEKESDTPPEATQQRPVEGQSVTGGGAASTSGSMEAMTTEEEEEATTTPNNDYQPFTTAFDTICPASALSNPAEMQQLRLQLDTRLQPFQQLINRLAHRLQRQLWAQQQSRWYFDQEQGQLDASRITQLITNPQQHRLFKTEDTGQQRATQVTLLLDNSGSMRGQPILMTALCADILARTLERCQVSIEVLGFTTNTWKGGKVRDAWIKANKPMPAGRLNELLHIIYKPANARYRRSRGNFGVLLKEGVLKENIDGEALQWAAGRLLRAPAQRKILLVLSDGAPIDDATLSTNTPSYLEDHLRQVIGTLEVDKRISLAAIGIGHDVTRYYSNAISIPDVQTLGEVLLENKVGKVFKQ